MEDGAECTCGHRGCLETVASVPSILRNAARRAGRPDADVAALPWDLHELEGELGPQPTREAVAAAGRHLGAVLAALVAILDVHQIAIEVELAGAEDLVVEAVRAEVADRVLPSIASVVEFSETSHRSDLVLVGAAAMVVGEELGVVWR